MSLYELIIVLIVVFAVTKPEDFPKIFSKFKEMRNFVQTTKKEIISYLDPELKSDELIDAKSEQESNKEVEQINLYLGKIANLGVEYDGEYSIDSIKKYYKKIVKAKFKDQVKDKTIND